MYICVARQIIAWASQPDSMKEGKARVIKPMLPHTFLSHSSLSLSSLTPSSHFPLSLLPLTFLSHSSLSLSSLTPSSHFPLSLLPLTFLSHSFLSLSSLTSPSPTFSLPPSPPCCAGISLSKSELQLNIRPLLRLVCQKFFGDFNC